MIVLGLAKGVALMGYSYGAADYRRLFDTIDTRISQHADLLVFAVVFFLFTKHGLRCL